jgi:hypothetical protein
MEISPDNNLFLKFRKGVIRTAETDPVIARLDRHFGHFNSQREITSIKRDPRDQLRIIINYALRMKIKVNCSENDLDLKLENGQYIWQEPWSRILESGIIANPPLVAATLYDYKHPVKGIVKAGTVIQPSSHFTGRAFDISGQVGNIIEYALKEEPGIGIRSYLIERQQDCTHCNV